MQRDSPAVFLLVHLEEKFVKIKSFIFSFNVKSLREVIIEVILRYFVLHFLSRSYERGTSGNVSLWTTTAVNFPCTLFICRSLVASKDNHGFASDHEHV